MNIIDAVKSGKKFRRKANCWSWIAAETIAQCHFQPEDILATDWEIEERKVTITEGEFDAAWEVAERHLANPGKELKRRLFDK